MFRKSVKTKDGNEKVVTADTREELNEAVAIARQDKLPEQVDITVPGDNAVVSPDNLHTEPAPVWDAAPEVEETEEQPRDEHGHFKKK